jgi:ParB family transcriptional regulator, chromosome partitioning protein
VVRQSGLGKGLGALIPGNDGPPEVRVPAPAAETAASTTGLLQLPISSIVPNRFQTRESFDETALEELASSIRELGVLQPILVRPQGDGETYELIAGERRWRAARRAGLDRIPAVVRETSDGASVIQVLVENLQREDLDPLEEAAGFQQMISELGLTHDDVAQKVGKSRSAVSNSLRLLQLSPSLQRMLKTRELSAGHARALLAISDRAFQESLAKKAAAEGMSVRGIEQAVQLRSELAAGRSGATAGREPKQATSRSDRPAGLLELEQLLSDQLNTRIVIEFADLEDLERIFQAMSGSDDELD